MSSPLTKVRQRQIAQNIDAGKRLDGRGLTDYREFTIEQGLIEKAEGSARVFLGKTQILVGVKVETGEPFPDTPNEGVMTVNAELVPLASPTYETGPPDETSIELTGEFVSQRLLTLRNCVLSPERKFSWFSSMFTYLTTTAT
jgi:exosome complex component RRP42